MRRTKIVCTIGPASQKQEVLQQMIMAGMDVARLNFSHGTHEFHYKTVELVRAASQAAGITTSLLLDTKGPEIRVGMMENDAISVAAGDKITLTTEKVLGTKERIHINYEGLPQDVGPGGTILIDDGLIVLEVVSIHGNEIVCEVKTGGPIKNQKGVNVPGIEINLPAVTEQDVKDIHFGIDNNFDFIAASFVRKASDVLEIRRVLESRQSEMHIISKIESRQAVENIDDIIKVSDGIMVARGDLGVEIPTEEVPLMQKMIIDKCNRAGKPVITATQMLESMTNSPRPTRAEASDVANAILDGTDAVMLSGETAAGKYPVETVKMMARIAERAENALAHEAIINKCNLSPARTVTDAISHATVTTAQDLGASAILTATKSGHTARMVSKYRPRSPIIAVTTTEEVIRKLKLVWGVQPILIPETHGTDEMFRVAIEGALAGNYIDGGDLVVITAGVPLGIKGTTNLLKVHIVGEVVARGVGIGAGAVTGKAVIARTAVDANRLVGKGDLLITPATDKDYMPALEKAGAIITEEGGLTSHAAIVALNLGIPVVVGVDGATAMLEADQVYTIDGRRGLIYLGATKVL